MLLGVACSSMLLISITEVLQDVVVEEEGVTPCNLTELVIGTMYPPHPITIPWRTFGILWSRLGSKKNLEIRERNILYSSVVGFLAIISGPQRFSCRRSARKHIPDRLAISKPHQFSQTLILGKLFYVFMFLWFCGFIVF